MKSNNRSNALLVELLIVVLFFMLAATVLLQVFAAARQQGARAELLSSAAAGAQNVAETMAAAESPEDALQAMGFTRDGEDWMLAAEKCQTRVSTRREDTASGVMLRQTVTVTADGETLLSLPCSRYEEVRP